MRSGKTITMIQDQLTEGSVLKLNEAIDNTTETLNEERGDMKKAQQIFKAGCGVKLIHEDITRFVCLKKYSENRSRPLLMSIRTIDKKELFQKPSETEKSARKNICES